jgi:hypothetical protein
MRPLPTIGLIILVLGIMSFFITIPQKQRQGVEIGGASVGVETTTSQHIPPWASGLLIVGGLVLIAMGNRKGRP